MAAVEITLSNGINTSTDEIRLPAGFLIEARNAIYHPDDPDRLWKTPGRAAHMIVDVPIDEAPRGIQLVSFSGLSGQSVRLFAYVKGTIYDSSAGGVSGVFADTGQYYSGHEPKAVYDGTDRWVFFSKKDNERPRVFDADLKFRSLGLRKANQPSISAASSSGTYIYPDSDAGDFFDGSKAYDRGSATNWIETAAKGQLSANGYAIHTFSFSDAGSTANHYLFGIISGGVTLPTSPSQATPGGVVAGAGGASGSAEAVVARLKIEVSTDGGSNYTSIFEREIPFTNTLIAHKLTNSILWTNVVVKATLTYAAGVGQATVNIVELWATTAAASAVLEGDYQYCVTELYRRTVAATGVTIEVESAGSDPITLTIPASKYGAIITLPSRANTESGLDDYSKYWRIYRTTADGSWPDMGLIGEIPMASSTYIDNFEIPGDELALPPLYVVDAAGLKIPAAGEPPPIRDAALFRGALVVIPETDPRRLQWSMPGQPDYFPLPAHDLQLLPGGSNDELMGLVAVNDVLLAMYQTRVVRLRDLPMANQGAFDLSRLQVDTLSPNAGVVSNRAYVTAYTQKGAAILFWVAPNGIWMTDGSLVSERGQGVVKITTLVDWEALVDIGELDNCSIAYDSVYQIVWFVFKNLDGDWNALTLHIAPHHWIQTGQDQSVPKITGPHNDPICARACGVNNFSPIAHYSMDTSYRAWVENWEHTDDALFFRNDGAIETRIVTGWNYLNGPTEEFHVHSGACYHSDWGPQQVLDMALEFRRDESGVIQTVRKRGIRLGGTRLSKFWVNRSGQSMRAIFQHIGKASGAFGPLTLDIEPLGETDELE